MSTFLALIRIGVAGFVVLVLPGMTWSVWFHDLDKDRLEQLGDAVGASIAITALVALGLYITGNRITLLSLSVIYFVLLITGSIGLFRLKRREIPTGWLDTLRDGSTLAIFGLILIWRMVQARDLALPPWVDSVHHVLIVRTILEYGGLPENLEPYLPVAFYYHYAFHSVASAFSALSELPPEKAVLWIGQALNAAVALSVYRLAKALWGDWRRAVMSGLIVGFVTQMPAYYLTWGRYTLLTGLVLMPLAMAGALDIFNKGTSGPRLATLALLTAGLFLSHYFIAVLFAVFLALLGAQSLWVDLRQGNLWRGGRSLPLFGASLIGLLLAMPWLLHMWGYAREAARVGLVSVSTAAVDEAYFPNYLAYLWRLIGPKRNHVLLIPAFLGLILAAFRKETRLFAFWSAMLIVLSLPWGISLEPFRPDHAIIILFLPMAIFIADLLITVRDRLAQGRLIWAGNLLVGAFTLGLLVWGAWDTRSIVNTSTVIANQADLEAIHWIDQHIPQDARFFINVTPWLAGTFRGVDGGWWITPLTGRLTMLPPVLYASGDREYILDINALAEKASRIEGCSPELWNIFTQEGITHVYLNDDKGRLHASSLKSCPFVVLVYEQDGVAIYRVVPPKASSPESQWCSL